VPTEHSTHDVVDVVAQRSAAQTWNVAVAFAAHVSASLPAVRHALRASIAGPRHASAHGTSSGAFAAAAAIGNSGGTTKSSETKTTRMSASFSRSGLAWCAEAARDVPRRRIRGVALNHRCERTLRDERIARHAEDARPAVTGVTHLAFIALRVTRGGARVIRESI